MTVLAEPILTIVPAMRTRRWIAPAATVAFLSTVAWFAHFRGWRHTGFFSDDQSFAALTMDWTPGDARHMADVLAFSYPEPQGRPLGFLLGVELPYLGYHAAGVFGMYAVAWLVLSGNAVLLWALLARRLPRPLPMVGGLMFLLFPADTTRPFLCHAHILQPSLTFALIAAHLFLGRTAWVRGLGYAVASLCLVTYETALLPLVAVPLLDARFAGRRFELPVKRLVVHAAVLVALVGIVAVTRSHAGEYRAEHMIGGPATVTEEVVLGSVRGPLAAAQACVRRPWLQAVATVHRPWHAAEVLAAAAAFAFAVGRRRPPTSSLWRAGAFGVAAIGVSYLLCFTHYPPTCEEGQSTSVHTAAAIGFAAVAAAAAGWALVQWPRAGLAAGGLYFGLLFGHATDEQAAFTGLWHERQLFWRQALALCPDLSDRTVILCDGAMSQPTWYMPVNLWSDAMVPAQVYRFPPDWRLPPILAAYPRIPGQTWRTAVQRDDRDRLVWRTPPCNCPAGQELAEADTILLRLDNAGRVSRVSGSVSVAGGPFRLRPAPPPGTRAAFPTLPFYAVLTAPR